MSKFTKPFRIGDVVLLKKDKNPQIISEVTLMDDGTLDYATNKQAWYPHSDFTLVRECDAESLRELLGDLNNEDEM